jgi:hypothetical protein
LPYCLARVPAIPAVTQRQPSLAIPPAWFSSFCRARRRNSPKLRSLEICLEKVREDSTPPIILNAYDDIDDINNYTRKYMLGRRQEPGHGGCIGHELHGFVGKVLEIAGSLVQ